MRQILSYLLALAVLSALAYVLIVLLQPVHRTWLLRVLIGVGLLSTLSLLLLRFSQGRMKEIVTALTHIVTGLLLIVGPFGMLISLFLLITSLTTPNWLIPQSAILLSVGALIALSLPALTSLWLVRMMPHSEDSGKGKAT